MNAKKATAKEGADKQDTKVARAGKARIANPYPKKCVGKWLFRTVVRLRTRPVGKRPRASAARFRGKSVGRFRDSTANR